MIFGFISGLLIVALIFSVGLVLFREDNDTYEHGYHSPEEAARAYLEGLRDLDVRKSLSSFAAESYVDEYQRNVSRLTINSLKREFAAYAVEGLEEYAASFYYTSKANSLWDTYMILASEPEDSFDIHNYPAWFSESFGYDHLTQRFSDDDGADDMAEYLSNEKWSKLLSSLEIGDFVSPEEYLDLSSSEYRQQMEQWATDSNADEVELVVLEVDIGDYELYFAMDTVCYNGLWYNLGTHYALYGTGTSHFVFR